MELKRGYKQTEVGVIPSDWEIASFDDVFRRVNAKKHQLNSGSYQDVGILPVVDQGQKIVVGFTDRVDLKFNVPDEGVVVFGDHTCIVKFVDFDFVVGADGTQILSEKNNHVARFHAYELERNGIQSTGYNRHFKFLKDRKFASPTPPEQSAIATALSDVDALLTALDARIAKQRDLKAAAMQQLLTGKTRLPGFAQDSQFKQTEVGEIPHDWGLIALSELIDPARKIRYGIVQPGKYDFSGRYMIRGQDYSAAKGWNEPDAIFRVSNEVEYRYRNARVKAGDLIMTIVGYCGHVEQVPDWLDGANLTQTTARIAIHPSNANSTFCKYMLISTFGRRQVADNLKGAAQPGLNIRDVEKFLVPLPSKYEQSAIVEVLAAMDAKLSELIAQREKTALLKQGMMQELLTGRTRLVQPAAKSASNVVPFAKQEAKGNERKANVHFQRSVFAAEIVDRLYAEPTFGHVKFQKLIYLAEHMCKVDIGANYHRDAAGPYDNRALRSIDSQLKKSKWFEAKKVDGRYQYIPLERHGDHKLYFDRYFSNMRDTFDKVIDTFKLLDTERCEIVATLYEAWHDLLLKNSTATDDAIVDQVLNHWHDAKKRIPKDRWHKALGWMRENGFVPG